MLLQFIADWSTGTAQITLSPKKPKTKQYQSKKKTQPTPNNNKPQQRKTKQPTKTPTRHRWREARESEKEKWTLSMPFLLFSFFLCALSSLLFWQDYVMLFFILFFSPSTEGLLFCKCLKLIEFSLQLIFIWNTINNTWYFNKTSSECLMKNK